MQFLCRYLAGLRPGKIALWCYLIWYAVMGALYFDPTPALWINSLGISVLIGTGLVLSVMPAGGITIMNRWAIARLYMMPFGVSSFAALIKDQGFFALFSPHASENLTAVGACAIFVATVCACKTWLKRR